MTLSSVNIREDIASGTFQGVYLDVPFVAQKGYLCGPAALSSVLSYWGENISQEEIARAIYRSSIRATLTVELEEYPLGLNFFSQGEESSLARLKTRLEEKLPVIVLWKNPFFYKSGFHYLVVVGYDDTRKTIISHTGAKPDVAIPQESFRKRWQGADRWMLLVAPPERVDWPLAPAEKLRLAVLFERKRNLDRAEALYREVTEEAPGSAIAFLNLGNLYLKRTDLSAAEEHYKKAIVLDAKLADAYNNLAWVYVEKNENLPEAERLVKKALDLSDDKHVRYMDTLGEVYRKRGMTREAIGSFEAAARGCDNPREKAEIYRHLGKVYEDAGDKPRAAEYYNKAKKLKE